MKTWRSTCDQGLNVEKTLRWTVKHVIDFKIFNLFNIYLDSGGEPTQGILRKAALLPPSGLDSWEFLFFSSFSLKEKVNLFVVVLKEYNDIYTVYVMCLSRGILFLK